MKDVVDLHTHTIASGHAYNTMNEMIKAAKKKKLEFYAITEHAPTMEGSPARIYFQNFRILPRKKDGMTVLHGVELNILNQDGQLDLDDELIAKLDVVIASIHPPCYEGGDKEGNTRAYLHVMKNPYVNIIGHPDDARIPVDYRELVYGAKEHRVLLEVNNSSLLPTSYRENAREAYYEMLALCKEYEVPIVINSDAHAENLVGRHREAQQLLQDVDFPEHLVANARTELLKEYLNFYLYEKDNHLLYK